MITALLPFRKPEFFGETFDRKQDQKRLCDQGIRVFVVMRDGKWRSLHEIAKITRDPEASVSARLRDLRKPGFGAHELFRRRRVEGHGTWEYRLRLNPQAEMNFKATGRR